jgi:hypothetical protein
VIPVIDLAAVAGCKPTTGLNILLITEYAFHPGGFCEFRHRHNFTQLKDVNAKQLGFIFVQRGVSISLEGRMDNFQKDIDDRANLTLSNRFELLLFNSSKRFDRVRFALSSISFWKLSILPSREMLTF